MEMALAAGPPEAAELVAGECVVLAETKDHLNWGLIGAAAEKATGAEGKALDEACSQVEDEEDEHLYHSTGWTRELWIESLGHARRAASARGAEARQDGHRRRQGQAVARRDDRLMTLDEGHAGRKGAGHGTGTASADLRAIGGLIPSRRGNTRSIPPEDPSPQGLGLRATGSGRGADTPARSRSGDIQPSRCSAAPPRLGGPWLTGCKCRDKRAVEPD